MQRWDGNVREGPRRIRTIRSRSGARLFNFENPRLPSLHENTNPTVGSGAPRITGLIRKQPPQLPATDNSPEIEISFEELEWMMRYLDANGNIELLLLPKSEWYYDSYCDWCDWWGYFAPYVPDKYELIECYRRGRVCVLCSRCFKLAEPPWRPNNRDRWHERLVQVFRTTELNSDVQRTIAEYVAEKF